MNILNLETVFPWDVTSDLHAFWGLLHPPYKQQEQGLLDVLVAVDLRGDGARQLLVEPVGCKTQQSTSYVKVEEL